MKLCEDRHDVVSLTICVLLIILAFGASGAELLGL